MPPTDNESHQQVYLVRFVAMQETDEAGVYQTNSQESLSTRYSNIKSSPVQLNGKKSENGIVVPILATTFPASISVADLLKAGKLVKPPTRNKMKLVFEKFDVHTQGWIEVMEKELIV